MAQRYEKNNKKAMAYNNVNKFILYQKVIDIVNKEFVPEVTTYKGIYHKYIYPSYPMSYNTFLKIINLPNLSERLEAERKKTTQLMMF